ncbi:MAG TPA: pyridoxal-phosphate dependent enzyme [Gemmatimonadaceae bacterium]|nr:pyridoxal-phosphate dependent enzyme [Gemmatimonadaceae bacterium]
MSATPSLARFATRLRCLRCGTEHALDLRASLCSVCTTGGLDHGVLDVLYDLEAAAHALCAAPAHPRADVFRWAPVLPVDAPPVTLRAGGTPLVAAPRLARSLGIGELWLKDDTRNPTRSLKDRATAIAMAIAHRLRASAVYCASQGNAAISLAGFAAQAGLECHVYVPATASETRLHWLRRYGAHVHVIDGTYDEAYAEAESAGAANGWYSRNCAFNPFLVEGKKTVSWEIEEQLGGVPDVLVAPVGDGCTLAAIGKGFREMRDSGVTKRLPRLIGVQSDTMAPLVSRFTTGAEVGASAGARAASGNPARPRGGAVTHDHKSRASSILVGRPRNALRLFAELRESAGELVAVDDAAIERAGDALAREAGVVCEFTTAAGIAGLREIAEREPLAKARVVAVITGGRVDIE